MTGQRTGPVAVIGDALIDEIHDDAGVRDAVGGAALNVAVGLARLGVQTVLIAQVGVDADGATVRDFLVRFGVRLITAPSPFGTARAVATKTGEDVRYVFNAAALNRRIEYTDEAREALGAASLVVVSCFPFDLDDASADLLDAVEESRGRLIVDPNPRPALMSDHGTFVKNLGLAAASARLVKIGDEDAELLYDRTLDDAADLLVRGGAEMVLATAGRDGAFLQTAESRIAADVVQLPGPIVDTIGAGDSTLSALTDAILRADVQGLGDSLYWEAALENAMTIAAATCRSEGALLQLP